MFTLRNHPSRLPRNSNFAPHAIIAKLKSQSILVRRIHEESLRVWVRSLWQCPDQILEVTRRAEHLVSSVTIGSACKDTFSPAQPNLSYNATGLGFLEDRQPVASPIGPPRNSVSGNPDPGIYPTRPTDGDRYTRCRT